MQGHADDMGGRGRVFYTHTLGKERKGILHTRGKGILHTLGEGYFIPKMKRYDFRFLKGCTIFNGLGSVD